MVCKKATYPDREDGKDPYEISKLMDLASSGE